MSRKRRERQLKRRVSGKSHSRRIIYRLEQERAFLQAMEHREAMREGRPCRCSDCRARYVYYDK